MAGSAFAISTQACTIFGNKFSAESGVVVASPFFKQETDQE
jgi:hypothetical protein